MYEVSSNIKKSFSFLNILIELSKGKRLTGYDVLVHLKGFGIDVSPGTIYHQLGMLSKDGVIRGVKEEGKTFYEMTEMGVEAFEVFKERWRKPLEHAYQNLRS